MAKFKACLVLGLGLANLAKGGLVVVVRLSEGVWFSSSGNCLEGNCPKAIF